MVVYVLRLGNCYLEHDGLKLNLVGPFHLESAARLWWSANQFKCIATPHANGELVATIGTMHAPR